MYNTKHLEWHLDDENGKTPQVSVWSCKVAGVTFVVFNRLAAAHAKSQDHRVTFGVFSFGADRTPSVSKHPVLVAWKKRDAVSVMTPTAWRSVATTKTSSYTDYQRLAHDTGRSTIGIRRFASSRPFLTGVNEHGQ
jgi:hypothetical protein